MPVTLKELNPISKRMLTTEDGNTFTLLVQKPSVQAVLNDKGRIQAAFFNPERTAVEFGSRSMARVLEVCVGWENVVDDTGKVVPFTDENLVLMLMQLPDVLQQVVEIADTIYETGVTEEEVKKLDTPSGTSSKDGETSTRTSDSGDDSDSSTDLQSPSD